MVGPPHLCYVRHHSTSCSQVTTLGIAEPQHAHHAVSHSVSKGDICNSRMQLTVHAYSCTPQTALPADSRSTHTELPRAWKRQECTCSRQQQLCAFQWACTHGKSAATPNEQLWDKHSLHPAQWSKCLQTHHDRSALSVKVLCNVSRLAAHLCTR